MQDICSGTVDQLAERERENLPFKIFEVIKKLKSYNFIMHKESVDKVPKK